ncbi:xanthine dehydrogenase [[Phormidium ambiguum] IAM M-71]|uniref:Xanthine dehydrogenase n=1 Tax=[Phormidium ambiguum] IAM M-71 TaxID=454136 RepID=A0A1U7IQ10_9CYAN|nr:XdhC/CoxI family protein [Phormidium ambiguum]OKH39414.1 xanthine dehydrogenase [Phormidium ambiguum IAM M-71]
MSVELFQQLTQVLTKGAAVLATVTQIKGSVPREVGAKMIIDADGQIMNTIGGGAGEAKVICQAMQVLETGEKQFVEIDLSGVRQRETQGVCGGRMQVWLERWSGESAIALSQKILQLLKAGQSVTLITPFTPNQQPYILDNFSPIPQLENAFIEQIEPPPTLLIIGAGHVGEQLAKFAHLIGFEIAIQDDRIEFANPEKFPQANLIFNQPINSIINNFADFSQLYIALVTRGYMYDLEALQILLNHNITCKYIGMIGSEKRVKFVYRKLQEMGVSPELFSNIYAPIGLEIGALTPEEIAVSICAELILVRRGGTGKSISQSMKKLLA